MVNLMTTEERNEFLRKRTEDKDHPIQNGAIQRIQSKYENLFDLKTIDRIMKTLMYEDYTACYETDSDDDDSRQNAKVDFEPVASTTDQSSDILQHSQNRPTGDRLTCSFYGADIKRKFRDMAFEVLSYCYRTDRQLAIEIVQQKHPLWGYKNVLTLAANGRCRHFLAHPCCQNVLADIWYGQTKELSWKEQIKELKYVMHRRERHPSSSADRKRNQNRSKSTRSLALLEVRQDEDKRTCCSRFGRGSFKLMNYLFHVPKGKLQLHVFIYLAFLGLLSHVVLIKPGKLHKAFEWVSLIIVTSMAVDEFRQILDVRKDSNWMKLKEWSKNIWNHLDVYSAILFYVGFAFTFYDQNVSKPVLAMALLLFYVKLAKFFRTFSTLGPYLVMIYRMIAHMTGFLLVLLLAVVAYGIFMHAMLFPDSTLSWKIIFGLLFRPYLLVFGEMGLNNHELSANATVYGTTKLKSEAMEISVIIAMCVYLLFANVLLLNLLIAVFNNIYEDVKDNADEIWKFEKYDMIMEFHWKPALPIPFSIIPNLWRIFKRVIHSICSSFGNERRRGNVDVDWGLLDFQRRCMRGYCNEKDQEMSSSLDENVKQIKEKVESTAKTLADLEDRIEERFGSLEKIWRRKRQPPGTLVENHMRY